MKSRKSNTLPAFFKPFVAEDREHRLVSSLTNNGSLICVGLFIDLGVLILQLIPPFFSEFMKDRMPNSAFIRDRNENLWHVEISQRENRRFFEAGWSNFVQDKKIQYTDCLVFQFDGESFFDVMIFGGTACEKEFCDFFEAQVKEEEIEEEDTENHEVEDGEDKEMKEEDGPDENYRGEMDDDGHGNDDQDEIVELRDENKRKRHNEAKSSLLADDIIFDSGIVDRPKKNPYFVGKLDPKRKSDLRVPTDVIRDFNLKLPERINICDEDGRTWSAVVKEWNDGRTCITKGWRAFWKWNALNPNDKCLCEFVPAGNDGSEIQLKIRIFRATSLLQQ